MMEPAIFEVQELEKLFHRSDRNITALHNISFAIKRGEVVGMVGESSSGKTILGRSVLGIAEPSQGKAKFKGQDITSLSPSEMVRMRKSMQIIKLLEEVGVSAEHLHRYPQKFSGGQRQRIGISRNAVNTEPLVADECVSALSRSKAPQTTKLNNGQSLACWHKSDRGA